MAGLRPVSVVADIFFPRPDQLDRLARRLRHGDRLDQLVIDRAPAEAAAEEAIVDEDALGRQAAGLGGEAERRLGILRSEPDIDPVGWTWAVQFSGSIGAWAR